MKKLLCFLVAVLLGVGFVRVGVNTLAIADSTSFCDVKLVSDSGVLNVVAYKFTLRGVEYEYSSEGFTDGENSGYFKYDGVLSLVEPDFGEGYGKSEGLYQVDKGTDVFVEYEFSTETSKNLYRVQKLEYRAGATTYNTIATPTYNSLTGETYFVGGTEVDGYRYYSYYENYNFMCKMDGDRLSVVIDDIYSSIEFKISCINKYAHVNFTGTGAAIGSADFSQYLFDSKVNITLNPEDNKIIDTVTVKIGGVEVIKFYGGLYANGEYLYKGGETAKEKQINIANFAYGYESLFAYHQVTGEEGEAWISLDESVLYEEPEDPEGEPVLRAKELEELFVFKFLENGEIEISTTRIPRDIEVNITTQKYVIVDLMLHGDIDNLDSSAVEKVTIGETVFEKVGDERLPSRILYVGEDTGVEVVLGEDKYNFYNMEDSLINRKTYRDMAFPGGRLVVGTQDTTAVNLSIYFYLNDTLFRSEDTLVYISERTEVDGPDKFLDYEISMDSGSGSVRRGAIAKDTVVKVYVVVKPCYTMSIDGGSTNVAGALYFTVTMNTNKNIAVDLSYISIEREVYKDGSDEPLGTIKISRVPILDEYDRVINEYNEVLFKGVDGDRFNNVTYKNPFVYGYNLVNIKAEGIDQNLLKDYGTGFNLTDECDIYSILAYEIYNNPDKKLYASFVERQVSFNYGLNDESGKEKLYTAVATFGSKEIYLPHRIEKTDNQLLFGGFYYLDGRNTVRLLLDLTVEPVFNAGLNKWKYTLKTEFALDDIAIKASVIEYYTVQFVLGDDGVCDRLYYYDSESANFFSIDYVDEDDEVPEKPSMDGAYNLIGWMLIEDKADARTSIVIDDGEADTSWVYPYNYEFDVLEIRALTSDANFRFIPVFQAGVFVVTVNRLGASPYNITISYGERVNIESIFKYDGSWVIPYLLGYDFLGYYDSSEGGATQLFTYTNNDENPYVINTDGTGAFFEDIGAGNYIWVIEDNLELTYWIKAKEYILGISLVGEGMPEDPTITTNKGVVENDAQVNKYLLSGFVRTDTITIGGFDAKDKYFISSVKLIVTKSGGESTEMVFYSAICYDNGGVLPEEIEEEFEGLFDSESCTLTLVVAEFIKEATKNDDFVIEIGYSPITYKVGFTTKFVNENNQLIKAVSTTTVYYYVKAVDGSVYNVDNWLREDKETKGWEAILCGGLNFTSATLNGISGLNLDVDGKSYSFKMWKDFDNNFELKGNEIDGNYNFVSVFTDVADLTIEYYIYNSLKGEYEINSSAGYFWTYDKGTYALIDVRTANSYETVFINGKYYFISCWTSEVMTEFDSTPSKTVSLNLELTALNVGYSVESKTITYYAVYEEFDFSVKDVAGEYVATLKIPNDANGNQYSESDIIWVKFQSLLHTFVDELSIMDNITSYVSTVEGLSNVQVGTGATISTTHNNGELYAIVLRKGVTGNQVYAAIKVGG